MSIELKSSPAPSKVPAASEGGQVKGKSTSTGESGAAEPGGFLSLLMSLGAEPAPVAGLASVEADLQGAVDGAVLPKSAKDETAVEITSTLEPAMDPALLLAQSMQLMQAMPRVEGVQVVTPDPALMQSLPALSRKGGAAQEPLAVAEQAALPVSDASLPALSRQGGAAQEPPAVAEQAALPGTNMTKALQFSSKLASSRREALEVAAQASAGSQAADANQSRDPRFQKSFQGGKMVEASPALSAALATTTAGGESSGIKQMERQAEKFGVKQVGGGEGAWGHQALLTGGRVDSAPATVETAAPSPETMVAEQVKYWISSDVQNAELTLDGFGKSPVEVSISLNGTEARVEFRTDQPEVRQVLEGSASHLKDLLQNEGMVLSGVSVGSSGQDGRTGSQEQERKPRPHNIKQATVMMPEPLTAARGAGVNRLSGRAIDLFV